MNTNSVELSKAANICISAARDRLNRMVKLGLARKIDDGKWGEAATYKLNITLEEAIGQTFRNNKKYKAGKYKAMIDLRKFCSDPFKLTLGAR
jgi:hypothetical protein